MALPCLLDYHLSAQLRPLVCWCNPVYEAKWKDIELSLLDFPIQSVLGCLDRLPQVYQLQNLCVSSSLKKWVKTFHLSKQIRVLIWPAYRPCFLPASIDHKFRTWAKQGITSFCKIIENGELLNFEDLCRTYEVGREDFYRYLQIRSFFEREIKSPDLVANPGIIQLFMDAHAAKSTKGITGKLYRNFSSMNRNSNNLTGSLGTNLEECTVHHKFF